MKIMEQQKDNKKSTKTRGRTTTTTVAAFAAAIAALLVATPAMMSYIATPAYAAGVIIQAKPQADPKDADGDGAVFSGVIVDPLNSQQVESIEGPTLLAQEEDAPGAGVIVGATPQITKVDECNPDDDVGVC